MAGSFHLQLSEAFLHPKAAPRGPSGRQVYYGPISDEETKEQEIQRLLSLTEFE